MSEDKPELKWEEIENPARLERSKAASYKPVVPESNPDGERFLLRVQYMPYEGTKLMSEETMTLVLTRYGFRQLLGILSDAADLAPEG